MADNPIVRRAVAPPEEAFADLLPDDRRISYGSGRAGGAGVARTLALARPDGEYVKVLGADDQLPPGTLSRDLAVLEKMPTSDGRPHESST